MQINLNGDPFTLNDAATVHDLLDKLELLDKRLAVEINQDIIPRSEFAEHQIKPDDKVEIVHAIGGG
jgi:sulfur carrier protein